MSTLQAARESIGLTRLQPSSNLWTHVFGKSSSALSSDTGTPLPPLGPIDKNATSTRVLLHDTQANLEKFSARIDALLNGFSEAKTEVNIVKTLFERDRETLMNDIINLVNRCQTQIQKAVGSPAQSSILDNFSRDVNQRLENLDKRLDAIQTLSQTHAQSLQIQIQAIQSLHEQQCSMLAALTPLMPLLQAIPLHIDLAKNLLLDTIRTTRQLRPSHATQTSPVTYPCKDCGTNKRPRTTSLSDNLATLTPRVKKRSRIDQGAVNVPTRPSRPTPVRNSTCLPTTPKLSKRSSDHNQPTSSRNTVTFTCPPNPGPKTIGRTNTGTRQNGSQLVPGQQHTLTSGDCTNALRVVTADSTNQLTKRASVTRDKSRNPVHKEPAVSLVSQSDEPMNSNSRKAEISRTTSNSAMPVQQIQTINDFRRTSTQTTTANTALAQGLQARQLKYTMTSIPAKGGLPPSRRRRSPPVRSHDPLRYGLPAVSQKKGRRFIPLLDSDDEEIASP